MMEQKTKGMLTKPLNNHGPSFPSLLPVEADPVDIASVQLDHVSLRKVELHEICSR